MEKWERRDAKRKPPMRMHGRRTAEVITNAWKKRAEKGKK